jgi:membrane protein involved in colicin uptake
MADDTTTDVTDEGGSATDTGQQDDVSAGLGEGGKKALDAERKARGAAEKQAAAAQKKAEDLARRLQAIEDRDKTETQKLAEAKTAAEREAATAKQELMRYRVAAAKKLPAALADRLKGSTEDEMTEDADRLLEVFGERQRSQVPSYDGGVRQTARPASMNDLIRQTAGRG